MRPELPPAVTSAPPRGWRVWWTAARPRTLTLASAPVLAGTALAWAEGAQHGWAPALAAFATALLIQIGTNLHNDAADYEGGNDLADRLGPLRVTAAGWASPGQVRRVAHAVFLLALLLGIYLVSVGGWPILLIGCTSLLAGLGYSGGVRPISHTPLGELFVWLFFGVVAVAGSYWLQAGTVSIAAMITGAAIGFPAAAVLMLNNLRDLDADARAGRHTLAAALGVRGARLTYVALLLLPYFSLPFLLQAKLSGAFLALLALPGGLMLARRVLRGAVGPILNPLLAHTAQYALAFAGLLGIGILLF